MPRSWLPVPPSPSVLGLRSYDGMSLSPHSCPKHVIKRGNGGKSNPKVKQNRQPIPRDLQWRITYVLDRFGRAIAPGDSCLSASEPVITWNKTFVIPQFRLSARKLPTRLRWFGNTGRFYMSLHHWTAIQLQWCVQTAGIQWWNSTYTLLLQQTKGYAFLGGVSHSPSHSATADSCGIL